MDKIKFVNGTSPALNAETFNQLQENIDTSKLDKMVVSKQLDIAGWYRVAKYNHKGGYAKSFIVNVNSVYNSIENVSVTLGINISYAKSKINLINQAQNTVIISKARLVREQTGEGSDTYLEIYYTQNKSNTVFVDIIQQDIYDDIKVSMLDFEAPTDTATVLDELRITEYTDVALSTSNLNDIIKNGNYVQTRTDNATTERNYPINKAGALEVFSSNVDGSTLVFQRYTHYLGEAVYVRTKYGDTWNAWKQL